jgi:DNA-binding IclR family transcriptional regulator
MTPNTRRTLLHLMEHPDSDYPTIAEATGLRRTEVTGALHVLRADGLASSRSDGPREIWALTHMGMSEARTLSDCMEAVALLLARGPQSMEDVARLTGFPDAEVRTALKALREDGRARTDGRASSRSAVWEAVE